MVLASLPLLHSKQREGEGAKKQNRSHLLLFLQRDFLFAARGTDRNRLRLREAMPQTTVITEGQILAR